MNKDLFIFGLSSAGKDTISNYLRNEHEYLKLRIAGTIKQFVFETYGFKTQDEFEQEKRTHKDVRTAHNTFGKYYDSTGKSLSGFEASENRIKALITRNALEFEITKDLKTKPICIVDVRTIHEALICLNNGLFGIFLTRRAKEFADNTHKTEQDMFHGLSGNNDSDFAKLARKFNKQLILVRNHDNAISDNDYMKFGVNITTLTTDGTEKNLISKINEILFE